MLAGLGDAGLGRGCHHHLTALVSAGLRCERAAPERMHAGCISHTKAERCRDTAGYAAREPRNAGCGSRASGHSSTRTQRQRPTPDATALTCTDPSPASTGPVTLRVGRTSAKSGFKQRGRCQVRRRAQALVDQGQDPHVARRGTRALVLICICLGPEDAVDGGTK